MPKPTRMDIVWPLYSNHGRCTLRYRGSHQKLRSSIEPPIKRCYNVFLICPAAPPSASVRAATCPLRLRLKRQCKDTNNYRTGKFFFASPQKKVCPELVIQPEHIERDGSQIRILYVVFHNICISNISHLLALLVATTHLKGAPINNKIHKIV